MGARKEYHSSPEKPEPLLEIDGKPIKWRNKGKYLGVTATR